MKSWVMSTPLSILVTQRGFICGDLKAPYICPSHFPPSQYRNDLCWFTDKVERNALFLQGRSQGEKMFSKKHGDVNEVKISVSYGNSREPRMLIDNVMLWKTTNGLLFSPR